MAAERRWQETRRRRRVPHISPSLSPDDVDVGEAEAVQRFSVISVITLSGNWVPLKMFNLRVAARKKERSDWRWRMEEVGRILMTVGVPDCTYIITYPTEQQAINFDGNVQTIRNALDGREGARERLFTVSRSFSLHSPFHRHGQRVVTKTITIFFHSLQIHISQFVVEE